MIYFKRLKDWICEGRYLFVAILLVSFTACIEMINPNKLVDSLRIYGLLLQLLGTVVILIAFKKKLQLFKGHGLFKLLLNFIKKFPLNSKPKYVYIKANFDESETLSADLHAVKKPTEDLKDIIQCRLVSDNHNRL